MSPKIAREMVKLFVAMQCLIAGLLALLLILTGLGSCRRADFLEVLFQFAMLECLIPFYAIWFGLAALTLYVRDQWFGSGAKPPSLADPDFDVM